MTTLAPSAAIDTAQFDRLLAMAGPGVAAQLTAQVAVDLAAAQLALLAALNPINWGNLRAQSHVVLGLAGILGAQHLHQLATRLNAAAQPPGQNAQIATTLGLDTGRAIDAVLAYLADRQPGLVAPT